MTTTQTDTCKLTTIGTTSYLMGPASVVIPGAVVTVGTRTFEVVELKRRGMVNGVDTVAARYQFVDDSAPRSTVEWGDDPQDNTSYWASQR